MEPVNITYRITRASRPEVFDFSLDPDTFELLDKPSKPPPEWARLEHKQCAHCPLKPDKHPYCPVALQLVDVVERFDDSSSIDEVEMEIVTEERRVIQKTVLQRAIASMLELSLPACGCPKTEAMRPLARFHLPLASEEENVFRVTSMYLLGQYFRTTASHGGRIEFRGLVDLYAELGVLHKAVASRLQTATRSDSVKNAITLLDMYSTLVPLLIEDELAEMRGFFKAFLPEQAAEEAPVATTGYLQRIKGASLELMPLDENDEPDWLKAARGEPEAPAEKAVRKEKPSENTESKVDTILKTSKLSFELVPLDDKEDTRKPDKPTRGRASFDLPDD